MELPVEFNQIDTNETNIYILSGVFGGSLAVLSILSIILIAQNRRLKSQVKKLQRDLPWAKGPPLPPSQIPRATTALPNNKAESIYSAATAGGYNTSPPSVYSNQPSGNYNQRDGYTNQAFQGNAPQQGSNFLSKVDKYSNRVENAADFVGDVAGYAENFGGDFGDVAGTVGDIAGNVGDLAGNMGDMGELAGGGGMGAMAGGLKGFAGKGKKGKFGF